MSAAPLPELLVQALERRVSGSFVLNAPAQRESTVVVASGRVIKARPAVPVEPLGRLLSEAGALQPELLTRALELGRQGHGRLGEILLQLQAVQPAALDRMLHEQLGRRLARLGQLPEESAFAFYADVDLLDDEPGCGADPLSLIWRCLRAGGALTPRQRALLAELGERPLTVRPRSAVGRLGLSAAERAWLERLRGGPLPLDALLAAAVELEPGVAPQLAYGLIVTRQLVVASSLDSARPSAAPLDSARPSAAPLDSARPSVAPPDGPRAQAAASAPRLTAPAPEAPSLPARSAPAFRRRTDAPDSVEHALERASRLVRERTRAERAADAGRAIAAAHACLARKQLGEAVEHARRACEGDPGNPEYLALHAWLRVQNNELVVPALAAQILAALDRAVTKAPGSVTIRFYRAQALKRLGRDEEAYRDFRFVARRAPDHIDAVREVRLHMMRKRERKPSGVLSKLFPR